MPCWTWSLALVSCGLGEEQGGPALQWTGMPTTVRSHAKINLGLGIGAPRPDGFHALATVYQTIELYDLVTVSVSPGNDNHVDSDFE